MNTLTFHIEDTNPEVMFLMYGGSVYMALEEFNAGGLTFKLNPEEDRTKCEVWESDTLNLSPEDEVGLILLVNSYGDRRFISGWVELTRHPEPGTEAYSKVHLRIFEDLVDNPLASDKVGYAKKLMGIVARQILNDGELKAS